MYPCVQWAASRLHFNLASLYWTCEECFTGVVYITGNELRLPSMLHVTHGQMLNNKGKKVKEQGFKRTNDSVFQSNLT